MVLFESLHPLYFYVWCRDKFPVNGRYSLPLGTASEVACTVGMVELGYYAALQELDHFDVKGGHDCSASDGRVGQSVVRQLVGEPMSVAVNVGDVEAIRSSHFESS